MSKEKKSFFYIFITRYFNERETVLSILCHRKQQVNEIQPISIFIFHGYTVDHRHERYFYSFFFLRHSLPPFLLRLSLSLIFF